MSRRQKYPRRPLVSPKQGTEAAQLLHSAPASRVARATALLAVVRGDSDTAAAHLAG
jgi:hypothetical protein